MRADGRRNYERLLTVAGDVVARDGAGASMRDIAREAGVGFGTMYRHFPTREVLLEALLRNGFEEMALRADVLAQATSPDRALVEWLRETVSAAHRYSGVTTLMMAAIQDPASALHASCTTMREAGARLLARAQAEGVARSDVDGTDLFALVGALTWLADQPPLHSRADHLFALVARAILTKD